MRTYNVSSGEEPWVDKDFNTSEMKPELIDSKRKVVFRRLQHLYPKKHRPGFFPTVDEVPKLKSHERLPHFLVELGLFKVHHYKSMFITQDFQEDGRYELVVNTDGRFEHLAVDDYVPVYEETEEPVWEMSLKWPWQLVLAKAWAKHCGGYEQMLNAPPMEFLSSFTNSNWRYYNLTREADFLDKFHGKEWCESVLRTKDSPEVYRAGLAPNQVGYELVSIQKNGF